MDDQSTHFGLQSYADNASRLSAFGGMTEWKAVIKKLLLWPQPEPDKIAKTEQVEGSTMDQLWLNRRIFSKIWRVIQIYYLFLWIQTHIAAWAGTNQVKGCVRITYHETYN